MKKNIFLVLYLIIVLFTLWALSPIDKSGGAQNKGMAYVIIGPLVIAASVIQFLAFRKFIQGQEEKKWFYRLMSLCCCFAWALFFFAFLGEDLLSGLLYLGPFLMLNLFVFAFTLKPSLIKS